MAYCFDSPMLDDLSLFEDWCFGNNNMPEVERRDDKFSCTDMPDDAHIRTDRYQHLGHGVDVWHRKVVLGCHLVLAALPIEEQLDPHPA